jgi:glyoxylase-like metal-dependent hydrolase (beta-lactamase superfamily II)
MAVIPYLAGLHHITADTWAYLQPPGTWGYSNCGLVVDGAVGLLVDTQFTHPLTERLLACVAETTPGVEITTVVTTHANGDHCWGNELLGSAEIIGSRATADGMPEELPPHLLAALAADPTPSPLGRYLRRYFGEFDFSGITLTPPSRTFAGELDVPVGRRLVRLMEVGPAHTAGDVIVHIPDAGVVYTGDILFIGDHPIMWAGPIEHWITACQRLLDTGAEVFVPGHGPVTDRDGVTVFRDYLQHVGEQATRSYQDGVPYWQAARDMPLPAAFAGWGHRERLVITVAAVYRTLGVAEPSELLEVLTRMAEVAESA